MLATISVMLLAFTSNASGSASGMVGGSGSSSIKAFKRFSFAFFKGLSSFSVFDLLREATLLFLKRKICISIVQNNENHAINFFLINI